MSSLSPSYSELGRSRLVRDLGRSCFACWLAACIELCPFETDPDAGQASCSPSATASSCLSSDTIVDESRSTGARLIVVGTHGRSGIKHLVLESTAERVVRMSRLPVLIVPVAG